jgi:mannose-6-phosphate isomerase-like protein (cupin superfamily)
MIHTAIGPTSGKGWFAGPWNSDVPVAVGFSDVAIDEPHVHDEMFEVYLVARGSSTVVVAGREVALAAGDALFVEPGEAHTFTSSSADYLHFVVQAPFVSGDKRRA